MVSSDGQKERCWVPIGLPYSFFSYQHSFARSFRLEFWVGVTNHQCRGRGGLRESGWYRSKERSQEFVSSYRPSILTLPLSLRVSEILPLLCFSMQLPPPHLRVVSPKFPHISLGIGGWPLGYKERRCLANCPCNFPRSLCDHNPQMSQTDGRTDSDVRYAIARSRFALQNITR